MDEDDDFNEFTSQDLIHIHKVNRRGRKCETKVTGIPEMFDYKKILKFWKNVPHPLFRTSRPTDVYLRRVRKAGKTRTASATVSRSKKILTNERRSSSRATTVNASKSFSSTWVFPTTRTSGCTEPADSLPSIVHISQSPIQCRMFSRDHMSSQSSVNTYISSDSPCSLASFSFSQIFSLRAPNLSFSSITSPFNDLF